MAGTPTEMLGGKFLCYINTGVSEAAPTWTKIGGQRKGKFDRKADVVKAQHKDSFPWFRKVQGYIEWNFDFDGVWIIDTETGIQDPGLTKMQDCFENQVEAYVQIVTPMYGEAAGVGSTYTGHAIVGEFSIDGPHDNLITYTGKLEGNGSYVFDESPIPPIP